MAVDVPALCQQKAPKAGQAGVQPIAVLKGHEYWVIAVALSPDGKLAATGSGSENKVRIWDTTTGHMVRSLDSPSNPFANAIYALQFSPDGARILSGGADGHARIWEVGTGKKIVDVLPDKKDSAFVVFAGFSPDGTHFFTAAGGLNIWESSTGNHTLAIGADKNKSPDGVCVYSSDGKSIYSHGPDAYVRIWDSSTGTLLKTVHDFGKPGFEYPAAAYSPDGNQYATIGGGTKIYDMATGKLAYAMVAPGDDNLQTQELLWSPDGKLIARGTSVGTIQIWDAITRKLLKVWKGHAEAIASLSFSPNGDKLITGGDDKVAKIWDISHIRPK